MSRPRWRHVLEYAAVRALMWPLTRLPYRAALPLGWLAARAFYLCMPARRREARRRVEQVYGPELGRRRARRIAWLSWRNIVFSGIDMARIPRLSSGWARNVIEGEHTIGLLQGQSRTGRGAVIVLPHMGSWELAAAVCRQHGAPVFSIAANQKNPLLDAHLHRLRQASGMPIILRGADTMRQVLRRLRAGEMLAILPDLRHPVPALTVPFLGGHANVADSVGRFARAADVPVFVFVVLRHGWFRQEMRALATLRPDPALDKTEDARRLSMQTMAVLDEAIRAHPDQWFWYNKRWVLDPLSADAAVDQPGSTKKRASGGSPELR
jgi:KDO2-lipid IV(A) lauroyltransferase